VVKSLKPAAAAHTPDDRAGQQFYLTGAATPQQTGVAASLVPAAAGPTSLDLAAPQSSVPLEAKTELAAGAGGFVLDTPDALSPAGPAAATFPADEPPVVDDTQILIALKDGSLFLFDKALITDDPVALRDALGDAGIIFADPAQGSDVLEEYGLSSLLGGWLADLQALTGSGSAGDLTGHNGIF
jgi:hypothetical protein